MRMSGEESFAVAEKILDLPKEKMQPNSIHYCHVKDGEEVLDEVLVSFFRAPHSYTAEDMVEINCHGGVYVTRRVLSLLLKKGCRPAEPGEFTRRAYLNGRIDLSVAEAANDMINARNLLQAKSAAKGLDGSLQRLIDPFLLQISDVLAQIEVNIDYPEYTDEKVLSEEEVAPKVREWVQRLEKLSREARRFARVKDGIATAIVGKPNVGKSSLLNALLDRERAIVTDIAGTTRDLIEETIDLGNISLHLIDTAGIRESTDVIEKIGIERSRQAIKEADLILLVLDASHPLDEEDEELLKLTEDKDRLILWNKTDLQQHEDGIRISAKEKDIQELLDQLQEKYEADVSLADTDVLANERQLSLLEKAKEELQDFLNEEEEIPIDLKSEHIREAYEDLCEILGKEYRESLIDHLFRNFCVGK